MASRRIQAVRACLIAVALASATLSARQLPADLASAAGPSDRAATYIVSHHQIARPNRSPLDLTVIAKSGPTDQAAAIVDASTRTISMLDDWLGPLPLDQLTVVDAPWNSRLASGSLRGMVVVRSRWITPSRDRAFERELIAGLARQYWMGDAGAPDPWFDALSIYTGGRAIDVLLEGSQFHTNRYLGGFVPFALRAVSLSPAVRDRRPRLRRYPEAELSTPGAARAARAMEVAERYLGWPAVQQALQVFRERQARSLADFVAIASAQRGSDVSKLFGDTVVEAKTIDYAVGELDSRPAGPNQFNVRLTIDRVGTGVFAEPLPVDIQFADGTSMRDSWNGREQRTTLDYASGSPATSAAIDPDVILILDADRTNNTRRLQERPWNRLALKLACDWAVWLQNVVVTYAGIV